jgi:hypothetical protein
MKGVLLHNRVHNSQGDCDTSYSKQKSSQHLCVQRAFLRCTSKTVTHNVCMERC